MTQTLKARQEIAVAIGVLLLALGLGAGAWIIPSEAGYAGVGPDFLCGAGLLWEVRSGGFQNLDEADGDEQPYWPGFIWMSAGLLVNAAVITVIGFIFSCAVCFAMASRGARLAQGQAAGGFRSWVLDVVVGLAIAAPVYWLFTQFLAIGLPGLTQSGWL
jgi:putative tricarboxylic transport membrane protein